MIKLIKNIVNTILETTIILCKGYFFLFVFGSALNALNDGYVLRLSICALLILIISNKIKDSIR